MKDADNYAQESQLTRRVSDWQSRILPLLEEQDARPAFDMNASGVKIIDKLSDLRGNTVRGNTVDSKQKEFFSSFEEVHIYSYYTVMQLSKLLHYYLTRRFIYNSLNCLNNAYHDTDC